MTTLAIPDLLGTSPADLIDRVADQPVATRDVAVRRAERIRTGVASYAAMRQDIADAYAQRDWLALDYDSWHAYVHGEFGEELRQLARARDERREIVRDLRTQGMSTRQIAQETGVTHTQVQRDLAQVEPNVPPAAVTGADGKSYPSTQTPARRDPEPTSPGPAVATPGGPDSTPAPEQKPNRRPLPDAFRDAAYDLVKAVERLERLVEDDRFTRNAEQVGRMSRHDLLRAADLLAAVVERIPNLTKEPTE